MSVRMAAVALCAAAFLFTAQAHAWGGWPGNNGWGNDGWGNGWGSGRFTFQVEADIEGLAEDMFDGSWNDGW